MANSGNLSGGRQLAKWMQTDASQASLIQKVIQAVNNMGINAGVSPRGQLTAPAAPNGIAVKASGGFVHATITDNNSIQKPLHYFMEYDTDPNFTQPHVKQLGASRTMEPIALPAKDDDGNPQHWHFRCYSQYVGSQPSQRTTYGGASGAIPVAVGGDQQMTLLPSTGSGTASPSGTQGGSGFGKVTTRPVLGPKRSVGQ